MLIFNLVQINVVKTWIVRLPLDMVFIARNVGLGHCPHAVYGCVYVYAVFCSCGQRWSSGQGVGLIKSMVVSSKPTLWLRTVASKPL